MNDKNKTKKQLLEELNKLRYQNAGLDTLLQIAFSINTDYEFNYSGLYVVNELQKHLDSPHVFLEITEPGLEFSQREGIFEKQFDSFEALIKEVKQSQQAIAITVVEDSSVWFQKHLQPPISRVMIHPMVWKVHLIGLIGVAYETEIDEELLLVHLNFLVRCGDFIAQGLDNHQILSETEMALVNYARRAEIAEIVIELIPDQNAITEAVSQELVRFRKAHCAIAVFDSSQSRLTVLAVNSSEEISAPWKRQDILLDDQPLFKQVINTKEPVALSHKQDAALTETESELLSQRGVTDLLVVPLLTETEAMGILTVGFEETDEDVTHYIDFLEGVASLVAKGIAKSQLYKMGNDNP